MNNYMFILIFLLCGSLSAMENQQLSVSNSSLMNSQCHHDFGLKNDYQVNWGSNETWAFIQAFKNKTITINAKDHTVHFSTPDKFSYFYSMKVAQNKFAIMRKNIESGKKLQYILRCLFLNKDVELNFDACNKAYRQKIESLVNEVYGYTDDTVAATLWMIVGKELRNNRKQLVDAFESGYLSELKKILQQPLCIEHIDVAHVKKMLDKK